MPQGRRSARRQAVFILYQQDLLELSAQAALDRFSEAEPPSYTRELVLGVARKREVIDQTLDNRLEDWSLARLGILERAIMRVATYELLWRSDVPTAVAINEAVEIAKRFCGEEAAALVNGVLGRLVEEGIVPDRPADGTRDSDEVKRADAGRG